MKINKKFLYLVVLGGRTPKSNIELHDVRWVIGSKIEDTFEQLRNEWFGSLKGFHIDSYKKIQSIDGYKINLKKVQNNVSKNSSSNKSLWFVNIGGYDPCSMQEKHEFGLLVASSSSEAIKKAKSKWLIDSKQRHKDDISNLKSLKNLDDCKIIKNIQNWEIELIPDDNYVEVQNSPDWFGYMRIDK